MTDNPFYTKYPMGFELSPNVNDNDCVIRALSRGLNKPYEEVLEALPFSHKTGVKIGAYFPYLIDNGYEIIKAYVEERFVRMRKQFTKGEYMIVSNDHIFYLKDGVKHDASMGFDHGFMADFIFKKAGE